MSRLTTVAAVAERLADWSEAARGAYARNTERAYRADLDTVRTWSALVDNRIE
jgi:hypothetical protein